MYTYMNVATINEGGDHEFENQQRKGIWRSRREEEKGHV